MYTSNMEELLKKAEVLIEALPYIQKFNRKVIVVKYGGSAMTDPELQRNVIKDLFPQVGCDKDCIYQRSYSVHQVHR